MTSKPTHRLGFSRIIGTDENGQDKLGSFREVGAVWPRANGKPGGIVRFDHFPIELTNRQGVLFIQPITEADDPSHVIDQ